jgi:hypothetical protein
MTLKQLTVCFMVVLLAGVGVFTWWLDQRASKKIIYTTEIVSTVPMLVSEAMRLQPGLSQPEMTAYVANALESSGAQGYGVSKGQVCDAWGNPLQVHTWKASGFPVVSCQSSGADGVRGTNDDISFTYNSHARVWSSATPKAEASF